MASSGPNGPASGTNDAAVGVQAWTSPGNITADDGSAASATYNDSSNAGTNYLVAKDFGFSIPSGSTIDGIVVEVDGMCSFGTPVFGNAKIVKGGTISSTNRASDNSGALPQDGNYRWYTFGGSSILWGESWAYSDINASSFGFAVTLQSNANYFIYVYVDYVKITVYYTAGAAGAMTQQSVSQPIRTLLTM